VIDVEPREDDWLSPSADVLSRVLDGEAVLLDLGSGSYFGLNDVATRAWELIGAGTTRARLRATLLEEFDVAPEALDADLGELLASLEAKGLVRIGARPSDAG
jgi:hypothetical protein